MKVAGLFAGIGGIELGFKRALGDSLETEFLCEWWEPAKVVLSKRFQGVDIHPDVRELKDLPAELDVVAAGFPCTDLSQAGRTAGIRGEQSGLVAHVFEVLSRRLRHGLALPTLVIENVPNMLTLDRGEAMAYLVSELEELGYEWAYRVVDSRFTGTPQRRRRVLLVASMDLDPAAVLFADNEPERPSADFAENAFGFYWTEGRGGLGWAQDAVPTLKGGSTIGIASPPAIWVPSAVDPGRIVLVPSVEDGEALQGFPRGWTDVDMGYASARRMGTRWKLIGNAVTVDVASWLASRLAEPGSVVCESESHPGSRWPNAAAGRDGEVRRFFATEFPVHLPYRHLLEVVDENVAAPLSARAIAGFHSRLQQGRLGQYPGFRGAVAAYDELRNPSLLSAASM